MPPSVRRSPLAFAVLGILEAGPLHPYGIQRRIRQWGKDDVINVGQRSSLYKMITRLEEAGLVATEGTDRAPSYPERTSYRITDAGRAAARDWLTTMLCEPRNEYAEFPVALSFVPLIGPGELDDLLGIRRDALAKRRADLDASQAMAADLPRVVLLDAEYQHAVVTAELAWIDRIRTELAAGRLTWTREELVERAAETDA